MLLILIQPTYNTICTHIIYIIIWNQTLLKSQFQPQTKNYLPSEKVLILYQRIKGRIFIQICFTNIIIFQHNIIIIKNMIDHSLSRQNLYHDQSEKLSSEIYHQYIPIPVMQAHPIFRHTSRLLQVTQTKSAIESQEHFIKLKKIMLGIKVNMIRDLFIKKLRRNQKFREIQVQKSIEVDHFCKLKGIQFSQKFQHFSIALNMVATVVLLVLASFSATLVEFSQEISSSPAVTTIKAVCLIILLLRILVKILGHTFKNGQYLTLVTEIFGAYIKTLDAYVDISTFFLLIFFLIFPKSRPLSAIIFSTLCLLYMRAASQMISLQAAYIHTRKINLLWRLTKILVFNFILAHIVATILMGISYFDAQHSWIMKYGIDGSKWYVYYAISYYWGTIIVTTVGFGDISCGNWQQAIVVSILVIFTSIILGFNISEFNNIFSQFRASSHKVSHNKVIFKRMMTRDENNNVYIDPILKKQIYKYIEDEGLDKGDLQFSERNQFINSLPEFLKKAYLRTANKRVFESVVFINQLKHETLALLSQAFSNHTLFPEEEVYDPNNTINILEEGNISLCYKRRGSTINGMRFDSLKVEKKQNLLLLNSDFLSLCKETNYGFFGKDHCVIWSISIQSFVNALKSDSMDFQYYFSILHKHQMDDDEWQTIICSRCTSNNLSIVRHNAFQCPQITYIPIRNLIIHRYLWDPNNRNQQRISYIRRKEKMFKTSVLKYYKNYFEALVRQKSKIQAEQNYLINFFPRRNSTNLRNLEIFSDKHENKFYDDEGMVLLTDYTQNYEYYYPAYNACNLKSQPIDLSGKKALKKEFTMTKFHPSGTASRISTNKALTTNPFISTKKIIGTNKAISVGNII